MQTKLVFLGGTCGNNNWRDDFIANLIGAGVPSECLFNPVVSDWNEAAQASEDKAKAESDFTFYYLGDPKQEDNRCSFYSVVEATMGLYDSPKRTIVAFDQTGMPQHIAKANAKACKDLKARFPDAHIFATLGEAEQWFIKELALQPV